MQIVVCIGDEELSRWEVPAECLRDVEGYSWKQNVEARIRLVEQYTDQVRKKIEKIINCARHPVTMYLSIESKVSSINDNELSAPVLFDGVKDHQL